MGFCNIIAVFVAAAVVVRSNPPSKMHQASFTSHQSHFIYQVLFWAMSIIFCLFVYLFLSLFALGFCGPSTPSSIPMTYRGISSVPIPFWFPFQLHCETSKFMNQFTISSKYFHMAMFLYRESYFGPISFNPIPTGCCHVTLIYGLIPPMAGRNRVKV